MAQPQAAAWQQLLNGSGFEEIARLVLGSDTDRPFVLVPPHLYSKLTEVVDSDTPGHQPVAARGSGNDNAEEHDSNESAGSWEVLVDREVLQLLASSQSCTLQDLRLIPDETSDSRQGGQWTADTRKWPGLIVFAVPSPLCHLAGQQQVTSQHMSLVILFNAPALGQSVKAATKHSQQPPEGRAMLLHLDPHSEQPHPDCKSKHLGCSRCKSCVFQGAEPAAALLPILMMLQRVIRHEGEACRQGSNSRRGRRNKMQQCNFVCGAEHHDHMDLYSVPVPPMLPLCMTATTKLAGVPGQSCCQCVGSCLVLLHWLSAWPPDQRDLDSRAAVVWNRSLEPWRVLPLSPAWYPPMYVDLLIRDLQAVAILAEQQVQQHQPQEEEQREQQREVGSNGHWQQQRQQQWSPDLQSLWKQLQQTRLRSGQLCYPGPLGHLALLKQLTVQQMQQLWVAGFSWSEGHMLACVQHLQHTIRGNSSVHTTRANDGASSSAAAAAASEAALDCEALTALLVPAVTGDQRRLSIQVCAKLAAGCQQFRPVPWCVIAGVFRSTAEKRLRQLTVVQARAQRYMPKEAAGQQDGGPAVGQHTPDDCQPDEQSRQQQDQQGEAGVDAGEVEGGAGSASGAGGSGIDDDPDQYPDWRVQLSGSEGDEEDPHWYHRHQLQHQQHQQQQQCQQQQQQQMDCGVVVDVDNLNVQHSPPPAKTAAQAPDQRRHQEQRPQQCPLLDPQHQVEQLRGACEGQQAASAPAAACVQTSLRQAKARLTQAGTGSAASAPKKSTAVPEQARQHGHSSRKGLNSCIQQQPRRRQQARQGTAGHKRRMIPGDTGTPGLSAHGDGPAAGPEIPPSYCHHQPMALGPASEPTAQNTLHLLPNTAHAHKQQLKQQQQQQLYERCSPRKTAHCSPAGPMRLISNSPHCHQKTTGTAATAGRVAGNRAAGAVGAAATGTPTTHPKGSPAGLAVTKSTGPCSRSTTGEQTRASAAAHIAHQAATTAKPQLDGHK